MRKKHKKQILNIINTMFQGNIEAATYLDVKYCKQSFRRFGSILRRGYWYS